MHTRPLPFLNPLLLALALLLFSCTASSGATMVPTTQHPQSPSHSAGATLLDTPPAGASDQNPAFSPDGSRLLFTRFANGYNAGPAALFLLDLRTLTATQLTPPEDQDNVNLPGAAWDPQHDRIVFASDRQDADDLWRLAPDGSDFTRITRHQGQPWYIEPSWSPDGQWIVFEADRPGPSEDGIVGSIWKVRADGTGLSQLSGGSDLDDRQPNWSPAGDRILFQRRTLPDGDWDIYTMTPTGSQVRNITNHPSSDTDGSWSPTGERIVYSSDYGNLPTPNIFVIPAAGGEPTRVSHSATHEHGAPSWSPDGRWIAFESHVGQDEDTPASLWRIAAPPTPLTSAGKWAFWTQGTQLRGANIYQRRVYRELDGEDFMGDGPMGPPYTQADFDRLSAMGANVVNISHPGLFTETPPYELDPASEQNLDNLLAMIAKADMFAIITFRTGPGRSEFWAFWGEDTDTDPQGWFPPSYYNNRVWNDQAAQDAWAAMWRYTAQKYKNNPIVLGYDLMCEPNSNEVGAYPAGPALDIWDPAEFDRRYGGALYDWNQFYPRIVAAIRQVDPSTPILVGGNGYSSVDWLPYLQPTGDPYTVYTVHQYAPQIYTHQEPPDLAYSYPGYFDANWDDEPEQVNQSWLAGLLSPIDAYIAAHQAPVAVNEYGLMRWEPGADRFLDDEMALFEQHGLNNALWLWESSWPPYAAAVDAFNFRHGPDPNHHRDVPDSALQNVIKSYWSRNTLRPSTLSSTTYYIRPDGGSATQCTGRVNAPYPGSGSAQPCAWDHPFRALPPAGPPRIQGGDTLIIAAGDYRMGYGAPETSADPCSPAYPWDCTASPIPSGPDAAHPTRILGQGWDSGCSQPPTLWGSERADHVLDLRGSDHILLACLEITDHAGCAEFHSGGLACPRQQYPFGDWAGVGLVAQDSSDVTLRDINIHGMANAGIRAGRLHNWTLERVKLVGNGWVGWDGDIDGSDSNSGALTFRQWTVSWNGCVETYPGQQPSGCWAQTAGGYGDGVGTGATGGAWIIEDSTFSHNTSDGLDLLYHSLGGNLILRRIRAEGNAGNPLKVTGQTTLQNSVLIANCAFFQGQPFTYNVDPCRALGNALELNFMGGEQMTLVNNTIYGQGDGLVMASPRSGGACTGSEHISGRNNLFLGDQDYFDPGDLTFLFYQEDCGGLRFESDYSLYHRVKLSLYTPGAHDIAADPLLAGPLAGQHWGMELTAHSPAIDAGTANGAPATDILGHARNAHPDIGAYEWQGSPQATATPTPQPTATPTPQPTATPTPQPTATPTQRPTATPTPQPTATPTQRPTAMPTPQPTATPTLTLSPTPTVAPSALAQYLPLWLH